MIFFLAPVSAFAARKARLQQTQTQVQTVVTSETTTHTDVAAEPPSKRPRRSLQESQAQSTSEEDTKRTSKRSAAKTEKLQRVDSGSITRTRETRKKDSEIEVEDLEKGRSSSEESEGEDAVEENAAGVVAVPAAEDGY